MEIENKKSLEDFIVNNPELEKLENKISEFNIFEAMGAVRQELRHSDFLAFMLNPSEKHSLGDKFLKRFLMRVLTLPENITTYSAIDIDLMDLSHVIVQRELMNIDILIHDINQGFICIIENKIYSGEHSNQLQRYRDAVESQFGKTKTLIPIFLSPEGTPTIENESGYIAVSYKLVQETLIAVRLANEASLGLPVITMIDHYTTMLRRHILKDSDIAQLCRKIYRQHKDALDLIFEHKPDIREPILNHIEALIRQHPDFEIDRRGSSEVRFFPKKWKSQNYQSLQTGTGRWSDNLLMIFMFHCDLSKGISILLAIGAGNSDNIRRKLYEAAAKHGDPFLKKPQFGEGWSKLYHKLLLSADNIQDSDQEDILKQEIQSKWNHFVANDFQEIDKSIDLISFDAIEY